MQMTTKICKKSEPSLSFSYENSGTEETWGRLKKCTAINVFFH